MSEERLVFDIESDGLYKEATKIHCLVTKDVDTKEVSQFGPDEIRDGLSKLYHADLVIGHHICGFDIPLIQKFYSKFKVKEAYDTLVMCRLMDPERRNHTLDSYGTQFGRKKPTHNEWDVFSNAMMHRCTEDVEINYTLYDYLINKEGGWDWKEARLMEQEIATIHLMQTIAGVTVDIKHAVKVVSDIDSELSAIDIELNEKIPHHYVPAYNAPITLPFKANGGLRKNVEDWFDVRLDS